MGKLTVRGIAGLKKVGRHGDGDGLYLSVSPSGTRSWVFLYQRAGKRHELGLGPFSGTTLSAARAAAQEARQLIRQGIDPISARKPSTGVLFGAIADQFIEERVEKLKNQNHRRQWIRNFTEFAAPICNIPIDEVSVEHVLGVIRPVWNTRRETAAKLRNHLYQAFAYARALDKRTGPKALRSRPNPAAWEGNLKDILPKQPPIVRHYPAMPFRNVPAFVAQLREQGTMSALVCEFTILTAARSSEARGATWGEIDRDESVWNVPPERAKMRKLHRIPLAHRALEILDEVSRLSDCGADDLIFPAPRGKQLRPSAVARLLIRMGTTGTTLHGFRSSFRDWCGDMTDYPREVAEAALAHVVGGRVEQAYRRSDSLAKRRVLMDEWADYCSSLCKR